MCQSIHAELHVEYLRSGSKPHLQAARVRVNRLPTSSSTTHVRISFIGQGHSGKSTLISVLTRGVLDNGRGLARMQVLRHMHEIENGQTSCMSHQIFAAGREELSTRGFGYDCLPHAALPSRKLVTLMDLAGARRYFKTTASGLTGHFPDYACLVVDGACGIESVAREHLYTADALGISIFVVITKADLATKDSIQQILQFLGSFFQCSQFPRRLSVLRRIEDAVFDSASIIHSDGIVPVIAVSNVTGDKIDILQHFVSNLSPKHKWESDAFDAMFYITESHELEDTGTVVSGITRQGMISCHSILLLGPDSQGSFSDVVVDSIEIQRVGVTTICAGQMGAMSIRRVDSDRPLALRKGMLLVHPSAKPRATKQFDAILEVFGTLKKNYQAVVHAGTIRQVARVVETKQVDDDRIECRFEFLYRPEYIHADLPLVFRQGQVNAAGKVVRAVYS